MSIEGQDYHVFRIDFPNRSVPALTVENPDGSYDIYINAKCNDEKIIQAFFHELAHIESLHFESLQPVNDLEREADAIPVIGLFT